MLQHIQELHEHVLKTAGIKTRTKEWTEIKKRVSNQIVLRVISCIQIASKLTSHYKVCQINLLTLCFGGFTIMAYYGKSTKSRCQKVMVNRPKHGVRRLILKLFARVHIW